MPFPWRVGSNQFPQPSKQHQTLEMGTPTDDTYMLILWLTSVHTCNDRCLQFLTLSRDLVQGAPIPQLTSWTSHCPSIDPPKLLGECSWPWSGSVSLAARWALASAKIREIAWHSNSNSPLWIYIGARPSGAYHCINGNSRILK